ncbi:MAG: phosphoenolpyruvate--protein phosphotransferase [Solidesulfovibrio sp. DCME]|uniref:phosphoenolpyruvate--protein phosphotransferase n=1 Tax=Solidesulfovibrio sp. DCME TaxID=3447380 RepID=UPI003D0A9630
MIGIVIVSHSRKLAEGVLELAGQMTRGAVPMEAVGGIDDPDNPIGTDPMQVLAAIESVAGQAEGGVLVVMDLGSALMSAETALDFLDEAVRAKVRLCAAPLVEGTVAAAVQAATGASLGEADAEAATALEVKIHQLAPVTGTASPTGPASVPVSAPTDAPATTPTDAPATTPTDAAATAPTDGMSAALAPAPTSLPHEAARLELVIANKLGLHARPAANLVATAGKFRADIRLHKGDKSANAKSINQVALLAVKNGDAVAVTVSGPDAAEAVAALAALHKDHFGERDEDILAAPATAPETPCATTGDGAITATPASGGYAVGPAAVHEARLPEVSRRDTADPEAEIRALDQAIATARAAIGALRQEAERASGPAGAGIFTVHDLILGDGAMREAAVARITGEHCDAAYAWSQAVAAMATAYAGLDDAYMRARAADVSDCGGRVLRILAGEGEGGIRLTGEAVVVAHDLTPSDVAGLDAGLVRGLVTEVGGATSHAAILARSLGIPAVIGAAGCLGRIADGQVIALDGFTGTVWTAPEAALRADIAAKRTAWQAAGREAKARGAAPAVTRDGLAVPVWANIGQPADAAKALAGGAEGVGLFRTEFLFQDRDRAPDEQEQYEAYLAAAKAMEGRPVIIRTLDIGGDKPIKYLDMPREANPFLGQRGVRFCLARPELFRSQLRALLRAAAEADIRIMYPMIADVAELEGVLAFQARVRQELAGEGRAVAGRVKTGIMIEVPSAVAMADKLASRCDFFSIGTNDLTQYALAADRGNAAVATLCDSLHPAVLRLIGQACRAAAAAGIAVGMCGELAGDSRATPLLLGLGLTELSMSAPAIATVKEAVRAADRGACRALAAKAMDAPSAAAVRQLL